MTADTPDASPAPGATLYGLFMLALAATLGGNLFVRMAERGGWLGHGGRVTVAIITVLPLVIAAASFWRLLRRDLDEMVQRIVLEGLAFAFIVYLPIAALYLNLRTAGVYVPRLDPPDILLAPGLLLAVGIMLAWRRVQ